MIAPNQNNNPGKPEEAKSPAVDTGNASNPSPHNEQMDIAGNNQLLDEKAEKYVREVASIEDVPDPQDQQDMDETIKKENNKQ